MGQGELAVVASGGGPLPITSSRMGHLVIYYQYRGTRARHTLHGIGQQVDKAQKAVDGKAPVKSNRLIVLDGAPKSVNRDLEAKARSLAGVGQTYRSDSALCRVWLVLDAAGFL